jgi:hypothetical protein
LTGGKARPVPVKYRKNGGGTMPQHLILSSIAQLHGFVYINFRFFHIFGANKFLLHLSNYHDILQKVHKVNFLD